MKTLKIVNWVGFMISKEVRVLTYYLVEFYGNSKTDEVFASSLYWTKREIIIFWLRNF